MNKSLLLKKKGSFVHLYINIELLLNFWFLSNLSYKYNLYNKFIII